jgi:succinate dehydrogenase / fumarate reductase flavoprotein subunit
MERSAAGLKEALADIGALRESMREDLALPGGAGELNKNLEQAGRLCDFLELGALMALDALRREESCGAHFRVEHATGEGEAVRDDDRFMHVAAWEHAGEGPEPRVHEEPLVFERVHPAKRSY